MSSTVMSFSNFINPGVTFERISLENAHQLARQRLPMIQFLEYFLVSKQYLKFQRRVNQTFSKFLS